MYTSNLDLPQLKVLIEKKMEHKYLKKYFKNSMIDEKKLAILALIINQSNHSEEIKQKLIISTTLVQVAIDIHELVPVGTEHEKTERDVTIRQLNVLSGDLYSGLYYLLLSEIEEIEMVHAMALAVKKISEYKMNLYYKEFNNFNEYIETVKKVESMLIITVSEHLGFSVISRVAEKLIIASILNQEVQNFKIQNQTNFLKDWSNSFHNDDLLMSEVASIIRENTEQIEESLSQSIEELSLVKNQIRYMLDDYIYNDTSVLEEG